METPDEFMPSNHQIHSILSLKRRRRNKRLRLLSSPTDTTSSSSCGGIDEFPSAPSSSISGDTNINNNLLLHHHHHHHDDHHEISTEEEEDMANCLILLAQGDSAHHRRPTQNFQHPLKINPKTSFNFEMAKTTAGFYVYECKTCNRTFPSFQALGGHRASHKKPKTMVTAVEDQPEEPQLIKIAASPVQIPNKTVTGTNFQTHKGGKVHECSICGLEFTSGQALGGHMRRHRATNAQQVVVATNTEEDNNTNHHRHRNSDERKERNILELDLNLPAPEEDLRETKFQFTATPQTIVFSAPTLVDCHY